METSQQAELDAEPAVQALIGILSRSGLAAYSYQDHGTTFVHVSPPAAPTAGTDLQLVAHEDHHCFYSEWGASMGCQLTRVADRVTYWFGKPSTRP